MLPELYKQCCGSIFPPYLFTLLLFPFIYLWLHQVLVVACGAFLAACGILSCVALRLPVCGTWAPECLGPVVAVCRLSCPVACGILVPQPGIEPMSLASEDRFSTTGPPGMSLSSLFDREEGRLIPEKLIGKFVRRR